MEFRGRLKAAGEALSSLFFPPTCAGCGEACGYGEYLCDACREAAPVIRSPCCAICSQPFDGAIDGDFSCSNCMDRRFHFVCAVAAHHRRGVVRELVRDFKYRRQFHLRHPLAEFLGAALKDPRLADWPCDGIVPVPLHPTRQRERGFNQAYELAALLSRRCGLPLRDVLMRRRATQTQTRFDRRERMENLRNAFSLRKNATVKGLRVLLVDDVLTTGSTLDECARVLMWAGAAEVRAAVAARS